MARVRYIVSTNMNLISSNAVFCKFINPHNAGTLVFVRPIIIVVRTPLIMMRGRPSRKWCWGLTDRDQLGLRGSPKNHRIFWNVLLIAFFISTALQLSNDCLMTASVWWLPDIFLMTAKWLPDDCLTVWVCIKPYIYYIETLHAKSIQNKKALCEVHYYVVTDKASTNYKCAFWIGGEGWKQLA